MPGSVPQHTTSPAAIAQANDRPTARVLAPPSVGPIEHRDRVPLARVGLFQAFPPAEDVAALWVDHAHVVALHHDMVREDHPVDARVGIYRRGALVRIDRNERVARIDREKSVARRGVVRWRVDGGDGSVRRSDILFAARIEGASVSREPVLEKSEVSLAPTAHRRPESE